MNTAPLPVISKPMVEAIIAAACQYFNCSEDDLMKKSSEADIVYRRKICFYLIKQNVIMTYSRIANRFGLKDGWNVSRVIDEIDSTKGIYPQITRDIESVRKLANILAIGK